LGHHRPSPLLTASSYTHEVAYDRERIVARTVPDLADANALVLRFREAISLLTFGLGIMAGISVVILLLPSILYSRAERQNESETLSERRTEEASNRSTAYGGSRTAALSLWARSQMFLQGSGGPDHLAPLLLARLSLLGPNVPASRILLRVCAFLSRINFRITHSIFEDQLAFIFTLFHTGLTTPMQVRTCFLDDCVETFVRQATVEGSGSIEQSSGNLVILGAGYDTRCYRLGLQERNVRMYEVDAPGTQAEKTRVLREINLVASGVNFCPCDFETEDWLDCLIKSGFDARLPTIFVWEGVTMYLPEAVIRDTLEKVSKLCPKSVIGFDYINQTWAMSPVWRRAMKRVGEPFKFAMKGDEPEELVHSCGLVVLEHLKDENEMARRYLPEKGNGRPVGILGNYGGFVLAGVPSS
jgi:methyltransferase (TIGR00027 family)